MPSLTWSVCSERGDRPRNCDGTFADRIGDYAALIIADGVTGRSENRHVNTIAINTVWSAIHGVHGSPLDALGAGIRAADARVRDLADKFQNRGGIATKLVACIIDDGLRCTALDTNEGNIHVITASLIENGRAAARSRAHDVAGFDPEGAAPAAQPSLISYVLGAPHCLRQEDFCRFPLGEDYLLLSSDSLTEYLGENEIASIVRELGRKSLDAATDCLVTEARSAGSEGTITVILARSEGA